MRITVFVNERAVLVESGSTAAAAVAALDGELAAHLADGSASLTDARGIEVEPAAIVTPGAILRVIVRARRGIDADA